MIALVDNLDTPIAALVQRGGYQYPQAFNATLTHRRVLCYPTAAHRTHHLLSWTSRESSSAGCAFATACVPIPPCE